VTIEPLPIDTGTSDPDYNLILVLQQALEDCYRYPHVAREAQDHDDSELADLFTELAENDRELAVRLKRLLAARLS
jgi:hypothetical protein